jgi:hypothetical protein
VKQKPLESLQNRNTDVDIKVAFTSLHTQPSIGNPEPHGGPQSGHCWGSSALRQSSKVSGHEIKDLKCSGDCRLSSCCGTASLDVVQYNVLHTKVIIVWCVGRGYGTPWKFTQIRWHRMLRRSSQSGQLHMHSGPA